MSLSALLEKITVYINLENSYGLFRRPGCRRESAEVSVTFCRLSLGCAQDCSTVAFSPMIKDKIPELQKLSTADKFALAVELWDELSSNSEEIPVTEEQLNELDRRFEQYRRDPEKVLTWEEVKAKILSSRD